MIVYSSNLNYSYGSQIHLPYSIACNVSALRKHGYNWDFKPTFIQRKPVSEYLEAVSNCDLFLGSCYVWNYAITMELAEAIEKKTGCKVILGGPQISEILPDDFFEKYPFVNGIVHNEGEMRMLRLADWMVHGGEPPAGCSINMHGVLQTNKEDKFERILDLSMLSSPYLDGTMDMLAPPVEGVKYVATFETDRGCPYSCHYCEWQSSTYQKTRRFEMSMILAEVEWFATHAIEYIDCANANFGIFPDRDHDIMRAMAAAKAKYGYPHTFRQSWAKSASSKIIPIARTAYDAGLLTAAGLAMESMDPTTLKTIERANIKFESFEQLIRDFGDIPTYTELIKGLPGETYGSFANGVCKVLDADIGSLYIYNLSMLPNTPMAKPEYIKEHGLFTIQSPIFLAHSQVGGDGTGVEYEELVIATRTATKNDIFAMNMFGWFAITYLNLGIMDKIWKWYQARGIGTRDYLDMFWCYCNSYPDTLFGAEFQVAAERVHRGLMGQGFGHSEERLGAILWPSEEAAWLRLCLAGEEELKRALHGWLEELQRRRPEIEKAHGFVVETQVNSLALYKKGDVFEWAKEMMWFGRRPRRYIKPTSHPAI